jgi:hypothetical protein
MATMHEKMQRMIRWCREETKVTDVTMHEVAMFALRKGWKMPKPKSPVDILAKEFAAAAREETRIDKQTRRPYRANHCFHTEQGSFWFDIDDKPPRYKMIKALNSRREQSVGDLLQMTLDADHWTVICPEQEPIKVDLDFTDEIEWRKNAPGDVDKKAG